MNFSKNDLLVYSSKQHLKSTLKDLENDTIPTLGLIYIRSFSTAYLGAMQESPDVPLNRPLCPALLRDPEAFLGELGDMGRPAVFPSV